MATRCQKCMHKYAYDSMQIKVFLSICQNCCYIIPTNAHMQCCAYSAVLFLLL